MCGYTTFPKPQSARTESGKQESTGTFRQVSVAISLLIMSGFAYADAAAPPPCQKSLKSFVRATPTENFYIQPGQCLVSANGKYIAVLQKEDGNFVVYTVSPQTVLWNSGTPNNTGDGLLVQQDGNVVIYQAGGVVPQPGNPVWGGKPEKAICNTGTERSPYANFFLSMDDDSHLVLYSGTGPTDTNKAAIWSSAKGGCASIPHTYFYCAGATNGKGGPLVGDTNQISDSDQTAAHNKANDIAGQVAGAAQGAGYGAAVPWVISGTCPAKHP